MYNFYNYNIVVISFIICASRETGVNIEKAFGQN